MSYCHITAQTDRYLAELDRDMQDSYADEREAETLRKHVLDAINQQENGLKRWDDDQRQLDEFECYWSEEYKDMQAAGTFDDQLDKWIETVIEQRYYR